MEAIAITHTIAGISKIRGFCFNNFCIVKAVMQHKEEIMKFSIKIAKNKLMAEKGRWFTTIEKWIIVENIFIPRKIISSFILICDNIITWLLKGILFIFIILVQRIKSQQFKTTK